jgi:hypothetical protein
MFAEASPPTGRGVQTMHRYLIKRTFPAGALDGLDKAVKAKVNGNNANHDVKWVHSYATRDKTTTFCIYEGPTEQAIRDAAEANGLPVDAIFEVPVTLLPDRQDTVEP